MGASGVAVIFLEDTEPEAVSTEVARRMTAYLRAMGVEKPIRWNVECAHGAEISGPFTAEGFVRQFSIEVGVCPDPAKCFADAIGPKSSATIFFTSE